MRIDAHPKSNMKVPWIQLQSFGCGIELIGRFKIHNLAEIFLRHRGNFNRINP